MAVPLEKLTTPDSNWKGRKRTRPGTRFESRKLLPISKSGRQLKLSRDSDRVSNIPSESLARTKLDERVDATTASGPFRNLHSLQNLFYLKRIPHLFFSPIYLFIYFLNEKSPLWIIGAIYIISIADD